MDCLLQCELGISIGHRNMVTVYIMHDFQLLAALLWMKLIITWSTKSGKMWYWSTALVESKFQINDWLFWE